VSAAASAASGAQDSQATKDAVATTAAVIIFWPAAFLVQGDKNNAAQLAQLKGQMDAIQQASILKNWVSNFSKRRRRNPRPPHVWMAPNLQELFS
jgi:hypothetical protein